MNLKKLRENAGLSQLELANKLDVARATYLAWENRDREPRLSELRDLARIFHVSLEDLIGGDTRQMPTVVLPEQKPSSKKKAELRISVPQKKLGKFREALLYILQKVGARPNVGETVLYKLLYFIDFDYYEKFEEQLIGATYIRNHYGPTPVEFRKIVEKMEQEGSLVKVKTKHFAYDQTKYLPVEEPDLSLLSAQELQHIDETLNRLGHMGAQEISHLSHQDVPWITAEEGKSIDYEAVFYRTPPLSARPDDDSLQYDA